MERTLNISESDLMASLTEMLDPDRGGGEGWRTVEIAEALKVSDSSVRKMLRALHKTGRLERVRVRVEDLSGRQAQVTGYRLREPGGSEEGGRDRG